MILPVQIPAVWVYTTTNSYNTPRAEGYPDFLTDSQKARVERIRQARMLFDGRHRTYYLDEARTQFDYAPVLVGNRTINPYITYNLLGLIAKKTSDLIFGEEPIIRVSDPYQEAALAALVKRSSLHQLFASKATDACYEGEAFLEVCVMDGQVYIQAIAADEIFPVGPLYPDGQFRKYCRYSLKNVGTQSQPIILLLETTYLPGRIERRLWQVDREGKKQNAVSLSQWKADDVGLPASPVAGFGLGGTIGSYSGPVGVGAVATLAQLPPQTYAEPFSLDEVTLTGIDQCTVIWIPNELTRGQPVSDFDGAIELQDVLNAKMTQLGRVLAEHADPKIVFPQEAADDQGNVRADMAAYFFSDPERIPKYITWDSQLEGAMKDRDFTESSLLVACEMAPVLLGLREGAHNDAYKKVKVQAQTSLKKAARKSVLWKPGMRRAIQIAQALENKLPGVRYEQGPLTITMNDGIPDDDLDQANSISIKRAAGAISLKRAIAIQLPDAAAAAEELAEIEKENAAKTPSVFLSSPAEGGEPGETAGGSAAEQTDALPPAADEEEESGAADASEGMEVAA